MFGYNGKILRVDLSTGAFSVETPDPLFYRRYVGGRNIGAYYLLREVPASIDPLSAGNKLVFAVSMLTGVSVSGQSRSSVVGKSPLTGGYGEAEAGGFWPAEFKFAGYDALIIEGRCAEPSYLYIHDGEYELRPASHLWGKEPKEVEALIKAELGDRQVRVAQIGLGGENLVRYACIVNDLSHFYGRHRPGRGDGLEAAQGRGGAGQAQTRGGRPRQTARAGDGVQPRHSHASGLIGSSAARNLQRGGPPQRIGDTADPQFPEGTFAGAARGISGETMAATILQKNDTCYACATRCKRVCGIRGRGVFHRPRIRRPGVRDHRFLRVQRARR